MLSDAAGWVPWTWTLSWGIPCRKPPTQECSQKHNLKQREESRWGKGLGGFCYQSASSIISYGKFWNGNGSSSCLGMKGGWQIFVLPHNPGPCSEGDLHPVQWGDCEVTSEEAAPLLWGQFPERESADGNYLQPILLASGEVSAPVLKVNQKGKKKYTKSGKEYPQHNLGSLGDLFWFRWESFFLPPTSHFYFNCYPSSGVYSDLLSAPVRHPLSYPKSQMANLWTDLNPIISQQDGLQVLWPPMLSLAIFLSQRLAKLKSFSRWGSPWRTREH